MKLLDLCKKLLGFKAAAVDAAPTSSLGLPAPAVPKRSYQMAVTDWSRLLTPTASVQPRTKSVRDRAYRRIRLRLRTNDRADYRRVNNLIDRDEAYWRVKRGRRLFAKIDDRNQKPLNRAEWRWLEQKAEDLTPTGSLAKLLLDWNGR